MTQMPSPSIQSLLDSIHRAQRDPVITAYRNAVAATGVDRTQLAAWETLSPSDVAKQGAMAVAYRVGLDVARYEELDVAQPYHNRTHTAEVLESAGWLVGHDPQHQAHRVDHQKATLLLMTAMVAHDWGHQGHIPGGSVGAMEQISADRLHTVWREYDPQGQHLDALNDIRSIIMGTEFTQGPKSNAQQWEDNPNDVISKMRVLANDADVLPSVLPWTGPERGQRLAEEWRLCHLAAADVVATDAGRLYFLNMTPLRSPAALAEGLDDIRMGEVFRLQRAARVNRAAEVRTPAPTAHAL